MRFPATRLAARSRTGVDCTKQVENIAVVYRELTGAGKRGK